MSRQDSLLKVTGSLLVAGFLLSGCSSSGYYYDRKTDYVKETVHPPLELPVNADKSRFRELMPLPEVTALEQLDAEFELPRPDPLPVIDEELPAAEIASYEGKGTVEPRLWLAISENPAVAWPLLQQEFQRLSWTVQKANPSTGQLRFVTDNSLNGQVVEARLRQGLRGSYSDLELIDSRGQVRTDNAAKTVLNQLKEGLLAPRSGYQSVSLLAQNISRSKNVNLQAVAGQEPVLTIQLDADRIWIGLELLLAERFDEANEQLISSDVEKREFTLAWIPASERGSILPSWIVSADDEDIYQLQLTGTNPVEVRVRQNGQPADSKQARQLLGAVRRLLN